MSQTGSNTPPTTRLPRMRGRDPHEPGRVASSLELFFDLVFVVAVSAASVQFHHGLTEGHVQEALVSYAMAFFGIWWAWMNFTWFATSFDTDDWLYRVTTVVQMAGVLVLAAGMEPAFVDHDFRILVGGYVLMRVAMSSQWLRAGREAPQFRGTAHVYAVGIGAVQVLWIAWLWIPEGLRIPGFLVLALCEVAVPVVAEHVGLTTPWHPHHITERYSLFTLILLGESLLASANAIFTALHSGADLRSLVALSVLALVVTASLWWIYFWPPHHLAISGLRQSLAYGYGHYVIFAAAGAFSSGVEVELDRIQDASHLGEVAASFTVTVPISLFMIGVWLLAIRRVGSPVVNVVVPSAAVLVLCDPLVPLPIAWTAIVMVVVVVTLVRNPPRPPGTEASGAPY